MSSDWVRNRLSFAPVVPAGWAFFRTNVWPGPLKAITVQFADSMNATTTVPAKMGRGKFLSLEEARKLGKLDQFAREHEIPHDQQHPKARNRFERLLDLACRGPEPTRKKDAKNV